MRRIKLLGACVVTIIAALPLLPGGGAPIVAEMLAVLETEFPWVRRALDLMLGNRMDSVLQNHVRLDSARDRRVVQKPILQARR